MSGNEAKARIKINQLLVEAGWRFLDDDKGPANILLENRTKVTEHHLDEWGEDFEKTKNGYLDFLLLDEKNFPLVVLEAKAEGVSPLAGKEQARKYAASMNCRYVILSNGNSHYLWDTTWGSPRVITRFPTIKELHHTAKFVPNPNQLALEAVESDYIVRCQKPGYKHDPAWINEATRGDFLRNNNLRMLRPYQVDAIHAVQQAAKAGKDRFLLEMATGTGKTLVSAGLIRLFIRTGNARRVLFLVDRLELERQAWRDFNVYLKPDYTTIIYKENSREWHRAEIVVSTVQTFQSNNRYMRQFNPDDFDLVISDEAHRSIGGSTRAVFEYFSGYKLGLTATPKHYLRNIDPARMSLNDPRELERRMLLDTYQTFGCEDGQPTFSYSLIDGVKEGYLISPTVVDARTEVTTQLLSEQGYVVKETDPEGQDTEDVFGHRDYERKFFSDATNWAFCTAFLDNGLRDPISGEFGKSIIFTVSQNHAGKIAQILNQLADEMYPGKYQSDFAIQVTSQIPDAQQFTINFSQNRLSGSANFDANYRTSKTRICVTVGMMTTGYDCQDILNLGLMRPIFSPTDFIQIKGRGTRTYDFSINFTGRHELDCDTKKTSYKMFDFFGNCEFFEEDFDYNEVIRLPAIYIPKPGPALPNPAVNDIFTYQGGDRVNQIQVIQIGLEGMRIDRMSFQRFVDQVKGDHEVSQLVEQGNLDGAARLMEDQYFNKPEDFINLEKLRRATNSDRLPSLREIIELIFGRIPYIKSKDELLDEEFAKFDSRYAAKDADFEYARNFFKTYILDPNFRREVDEGRFAILIGNHPIGEAVRRLSASLRNQIIKYIQTNVVLTQFS
jgi:type I restriction enzyme R subunit